jgi:hypothetical protein
MTTELTGTVVNGVVVWDGPPPADGTKVRVAASAASPPAGDEDEPTLIGLLAIAGKATGLPADYAAQHDHYLYGTPKR